jgi:transposase
LVIRAKIILMAAEGRRNDDIARELGIDRIAVGRWRSRFASQGLPGIEKDRPRSGRQPKVRDKVARKIIEATTQTRPAAATHWTTRTLAKKLGVSHSMVHRVWRANELKPHRVKTFKVSNDPSSWRS